MHHQPGLGSCRRLHFTCRAPHPGAHLYVLLFLRKHQKFCVCCETCARPLCVQCSAVHVTRPTEHCCQQTRNLCRDRPEAPTFWALFCAIPYCDPGGKGFTPWWPMAPHNSKSHGLSRLSRQLLDGVHVHLCAASFGKKSQAM